MDKIEIICDWLAATRKHADGDIFKSLEINQKKFGYSSKDKAKLLSLIKEVL